MKNIISIGLAATAFLAVGCGSKALKKDSGSSIISSVTGSEKDVQELKDAFKDVSAKLICKDMANIVSGPPTFDATNINLTFNSSANLDGKNCSVEINGTALPGKNVQWTSSGATEGQLYVSTESAVKAGKLSLNFYKTFQIVDPNAKKGIVVINATFTNDIFAADGADVTLKAAELKCDDATAIAADLSTPLVFKKGAALTGDLTFRNVLVASYKSCIVSGLFDPSKVDVISADGAVVVTVDKPAAYPRVFAKKPAASGNVDVSGTISGSASDRAASADLTGDLKITADRLSGKDHYSVVATVTPKKSGACAISVVSYTAYGETHAQDFANVALVAGKDWTQTVGFDALSTPSNAAVKTFKIVVNCDIERKDVVIKEAAVPN